MEFEIKYHVPAKMAIIELFIDSKSVGKVVISIVKCHYEIKEKKIVRRNVCLMHVNLIGAWYF